MTGRWTRSTDDEGSVLLVILATFVVSALVVAMLAVVETGSKKTRFDENYASALQSSDAGVQTALTQIAQLRAPAAPRP